MNNPHDIELLQQFEPVLRFTRGEHFYPMDTSEYVRSSSLWMRRPNKPDECLIPPGNLTQELLAQPLPDDVADTSYYLKLTDPASAAELVVSELRNLSKQHDDKENFQIGKGRLIRVGYISRLIDALFSISLLARGRVRGDTALAAKTIYNQFMRSQLRCHYHGRVVHQNSWVVLQYWFFYAFNNWRSGYSGANDHEADWESIHIYLYPSDQGKYTPEWVAYASHYDEGDDIRRHWEDADVEKIGQHPVVYVAAGSHASYYQPGEYLPEVELRFLSLPARLVERALNFWHVKLRQYQGEKPDKAETVSMKFFRIPFIDYARGDGLSIGPGQDNEWGKPILLNPPPGWITNYRGLWGLDAHDTFGGENAPAGPMFHQNGSVRRIWYDPAGWAGLDKAPPPNVKLERAFESRYELKARISSLKEHIDFKRHRLELLGVETMAMQQRPYLLEMYRSHQEQIEQLSQELNELGAQLTKNQSLLDAVERYISELQNGKKEAVRTHISRRRRPISQEKLRLGKLGEFWAAISVSILLIGMVALYFFARQSLVFGFAAFLLLFLFLEASLRGWLTNLIAVITIFLALASALVLLFEFFWAVITISVLIFGAYILWENLREIWS